jgi:hypothetical protein
MLKNDPPPGTQVKFTRELKKARARDTASLIGSLSKYETNRPQDLFEVDFEGTRMIVRRDDIE